MNGKRVEDSRAFCKLVCTSCASRARSLRLLTRYARYGGGGGGLPRVPTDWLGFARLPTARLLRSSLGVAWIPRIRWALRNPPKIIPNPSKTLPQSSLNPSRTLPKPSFENSIENLPKIH